MGLGLGFGFGLGLGLANPNQSCFLKASTPGVCGPPASLCGEKKTASLASSAARAASAEGGFICTGRQRRGVRLGV